MKNKEIIELSSSAWKERVYIETSEHIVKGDVFMPNIGKRSRLISEILNTSKNFIAVKNCTLEYKLHTTKPIEKHDFLEVNVLSILLMRPLDE